MRHHPAIEKSATRKGEYVGYCDGVQRIRRDGAGWQTYALGSNIGTFHAVYASTLYELGQKLDAIADKIKA